MSDTNPQLRLKGLWFAFGFTLLGVIVYLSLTANPPPIGSEIPHMDKWGHLLAYAALMGWFGQLFHIPTARFLLLLTCIAAGVALEFLQQWGGVRMFEIADMAANTLGVLIGWWFSRPSSGGQILLRMEQKLLP